MPTIFNPEDLPVKRQNGVASTTLADGAMVGSRALQIERVRLEAGSHTQSGRAIGAERFLYVVSGAGRARVGEAAYPLEAESVLWIESGDGFWLEAPTEELEVLICRAPAGE